MSKLYKYLPFQVTLLKMTMDGGWINLTPNVYQKILDGNYQDYKPVLRPFSDLTKELPLTKSAAEMIGMKEGELILPFSVYSIILAKEKEFPYWIKRFHHIYTKYPAKINKGGIIDSNGKLIITKNLKIEDWSYNPLTYMRGLDFLRAMKFAIDFSEDEYIKLEN